MEIELSLPKKEKFNIIDFYYNNHFKYEKIIKDYISFTFAGIDTSGDKYDLVLDGINIQNLKILILNIKIFEYNLDKLFEKFEGRACSHDKTCFVLKRLFKYFSENNNENVFDFSYYVDEKTGNKYSYHIPKKILNNRDEILEFFTSVSGLIYGYNNEYFKFYKRIVCKQKINIKKDRVESSIKGLKYHLKNLKKMDIEKHKLFFKKQSKEDQIKGYLKEIKRYEDFLSSGKIKLDKKFIKKLFETYKFLENYSKIDDLQKFIKKNKNKYFEFKEFDKIIYSFR